LQKKTTKQLVINASLWVLLAYGLSQILRLGGNLIVTRLLAPEMFGVMAVVYAVIHGLVMLSDVGLWAYVVKHKNGDQKHIYDAVWTLKVIRGLVIYAFVLLTAASLYLASIIFYEKSFGVYSSHEFLTLLCVVSATAIINGFNSMAGALRSRELHRGRIEIMELVSQFTGLIVMISWAYVKPSIWALAAATIVTTILKLILSYTLFPYRHRFVFNKEITKDIYHFGKWILLASVLTYLVHTGDKLYFGAVISTTILGVYSIAAMLAATASAVTNQITTKILYPVLSKAALRSRQDLKNLYYRARLRMDLGLYAIAAGMFVFAPSVIEFLYDERYQAAGQMLQILVISIPGIALTSAAEECLTVIGQTKVRFQVMFIRAIALAITLPLLYNAYEFTGALFAVAINPWIGLPVLVFKMKKEKIYNFIGEIKAIPFGLLILGIFYFFNTLILSR